MKTLLKCQDGVRLTRTLHAAGAAGAARTVGSSCAVLIIYSVASHRTPQVASFDRLSDAERCFADELRRCAALH